MRAVLELVSAGMAPPTAWSEPALVDGLRAGSLPAFERLFKEQSPRMKSLARNLLGNAADAEDAVQDTFVKVYRGISGFTGQSSLSHWVLRILVNTCYDLLRQRRRMVDAEGNLELRAESGSLPLRIALERALSRLSVRHRTVFLLFEVEGLRHQEIAEVLEVPEGTSRSLLFEAKRELRLLLAPAGGAA
jgi:RNA polymerase sigma-70 factor (ECF subfamily)